jgi:hypothetical protein
LWRYEDGVHGCDDVGDIGGGVEINDIEYGYDDDTKLLIWY